MMKKFDLMKYTESCLEDDKMRGLLGHFLLFKDKWLSLDGKGVGDNDYDCFVTEIMTTVDIPKVKELFDSAMVDDHTPLDNLSDVFNGALASRVLDIKAKFVKDNVVLVLIEPVGCMLLNDKLDVLGIVGAMGTKNGKPSMKVYALDDSINNYKDSLDSLLNDKGALPILLTGMITNAMFGGHPNHDDACCDPTKMN